MVLIQAIYLPPIHISPIQMTGQIGELVTTTAAMQLSKEKCGCPRSNRPNLSVDAIAIRVVSAANTNGPGSLLKPLTTA